MKNMQVAVRFLAAILLAGLLSGAAQAKKLNIITATTDMAALTQEVGGDRVSVEAMARGYQDPHFVEAKPSFLLKLRQADLLVTVGLQLEIGWLPPLITQSGNSRIQVGCRRLSRRVTICRDPRDSHGHCNPRHGRRASIGESALLA